MKITLIGGIDRLAPHYEREARKRGHELRIFNAEEAGLCQRIGSCEALFLCTGKLSHCVRLQALQAAKLRDIPVRQFHSCGLCSLRLCFEALEGMGAAAPAGTGKPKAERKARKGPQPVRIGR